MGSDHPKGSKRKTARAPQRALSTESPRCCQRGGDCRLLLLLLLFLHLSPHQGCLRCLGRDWLSLQRLFVALPGVRRRGRRCSAPQCWVAPRSARGLTRRDIGGCSFPWNGFQHARPPLGCGLCCCQGCCCYPCGCGCPRSCCCCCCRLCFRQCALGESQRPAWCEVSETAWLLGFRCEAARALETTPAFGLLGPLTCQRNLMKPPALQRPTFQTTARSPRLTVLQLATMPTVQQKKYIFERTVGYFKSNCGHEMETSVDEAGQQVLSKWAWCYKL